MDAREIESLSMIARGFADLRDANSSLSYNVILDILSGINEYVVLCVQRTKLTSMYNLGTPPFDNTCRLPVDYFLTNESFEKAK